MSEQQLADKLGKKRPYLNAISCGRKNVTIEQLERIAEGLGMTLHICFEYVLLTPQVSILRHDGKLWRFFLHVCFFGVNFAVL